MLTLKMDKAEFLIGRYGLDLLDDFYPEDLPTEWRFDYYSNTFNAVLLPIDTDEDIDAMLEDVDENFQIVLEIKESDLKNSDHLQTLLADIATYRTRLILWVEITRAPTEKILAVLSTYSVVFQSRQMLNLKKMKYQNLIKYHIYFNCIPVIVSTLLLSDEEIRTFLEHIATVGQKVVIICCLAEVESLIKVKTILKQLGY